MKIIEVVRESDSTSQARLNALAKETYMVQQMPASWLSAITSLRIAKLVDRENAGVVLVHNVIDAMAAISARRIAKRPIRIVVIVQPNSKVPKKIPQEIAEGVDKWLMPSYRMLKKYPDTLKDVQVRQPCDYDLLLPKKSELKPEAGRMLWMGPVDADAERLMRAIEKVDRDGGRSKLVICGTGKAQKVMPAVRKSRAISCPQCIEWKGEDYDITDELRKAESIVQSRDDATGSEASAAAQLGIKLIEI